jgi:hypothetical protein
VHLILHVDEKCEAKRFLEVEEIKVESQGLIILEILKHLEIFPRVLTLPST